MTTIVLTNNGTGTLRINDLAIELQSGESINLSSYSVTRLISSSDLPAIMALSTVSVTIDDTVVNYKEFISKMTNMSVSDHESLKTLKHNISETSYFETTKDSNSRTTLITYYKDSTKALKIREEEVVRGTDGRVSSLILKNYDSAGNILTSEVQLLNRSSTGKVESISTSIS